MKQDCGKRCDVNPAEVEAIVEVTASGSWGNMSPR